MKLIGQVHGDKIDLDSQKSVGGTGHWCAGGDERWLSKPIGSSRRDPAGGAERLGVSRLTLSVTEGVQRDGLSQSGGERGHTETLLGPRVERVGRSRCV
jgi:hypothetical protein